MGVIVGAMKNELLNQYYASQEKKHWTDTITKRGWFVIGVLVASLVFAFSHATRDVCWVGLDIVSCDALIAEVTK
jgi:hypothetical protein